ncbi:hypothetical protein [Streptomyces sp. B93]|uniref:hypothetical protein n=1 Tax=Streptomyces sp. B93 TaxID=2824875 RepID=UPI001B369159|nr:hypothetical protein [Streptomyces sp. B93]MBQ1092586.1 hypothetical protein [Streptomyces sp. B93]
MAVSRRRRSRTVIATTVAAIGLTVGLTTGCDAVSKALDCVETADAVADAVTDLQQAVDAAAEDPTQTQEAIEAVDDSLDRIDSETGDADLDKATANLREALVEVTTAVENGDATPDISGVTDAAGELTKVCTP